MGESIPTCLRWHVSRLPDGVFIMPILWGYSEGMRISFSFLQFDEMTNQNYVRHHRSCGGSVTWLPRNLHVQHPIAELAEASTRTLEPPAESPYPNQRLVNWNRFGPRSCHDANYNKTASTVGAISTLEIAIARLEQQRPNWTQTLPQSRVALPGSESNWRTNDTLLLANHRNGPGNHGRSIAGEKCANSTKRFDPFGAESNSC
jgi:hypothetical protein